MFVYVLGGVWGAAPLSGGMLFAGKGRALCCVEEGGLVHV
jgi:hypothetical protein